METVNHSVSQLVSYLVVMMFLKRNINFMHDEFFHNVSNVVTQDKARLYVLFIPHDC
jgi:TRAP-type mannitol/chloroaromatic compound transport system permease small subunit